MQRLFLRAAELGVRIYYRERALGASAPRTGPLLFVANHPNGLVDPILLGLRCDQPLRFLGKAPLFEMPVLGRLLAGLQVIPLYRAVDGADTSRNEPAFSAVYDALSRGDRVCLFPEGISHSRPTLAPLKTGAARMALGAEARAGYILGVRVVPIGLVYRDKRRFRSEVATWVGAPIEARAFAVLHAKDERAAVQALTEAIADGLSAVTIDLERWEDLPLLELAERVFRGAHGDPVMRTANFARRLRELREREPARLANVARRLAAFRGRLDALGVAADALDRRYAPALVVAFAARHAALLFVLAPAAGLGWLLWAIPYQLTARLSRARRPSAEIFATTALLIGLLVFPLWLGALLLLAILWLGPIGWIVLPSAPLFGLALLALFEWRFEAGREIATFVSLSTRRSLARELCRERDELSRDLEALA